MERTPVTIPSMSASPSGSSRLEATISGRVRVHSTYLEWANKRRQIARLKFSVRTLMFATLLCGSGLGFYLDMEPWVPQRSIPLPGPAGAACVLGAYSPDGRYLALGYSDNTVRVFATESGLPVITLPAQRATVTQIHISPDGKRMITATGDDTVCVWDMANANKLLELKDLALLGGFSPDSLNVLAHTTATTRNVNAPLVYHYSPFVSVLDIESGSCRPIPNSESAAFATFSASGKKVVIGQRDGNLRLLDLDGRVFGNETGQGFVTYAPDGLTMLAGMVNFKGASVLDVTNGKIQRSFAGHDGNIFAARYSPNGRSVVSSGSDLRVRVWDASTCELAAVLDVGAHALGKPGALFLDNTHLFIPRNNGTASIWAKNRPEYQLGVVMMPELWATLAFFGLTLWSIARDQSRRYRIRLA